MNQHIDGYGAADLTLPDVPPGFTDPERLAEYWRDNPDGESVALQSVWNVAHAIARERGWIEPSWRYAVRVIEYDEETPGRGKNDVIRNESADDYQEAVARAEEWRAYYLPHCMILILDGSDYGATIYARAGFASRVEYWEDDEDLEPEDTYDDDNGAESAAEYDS